MSLRPLTFLIISLLIISGLYIFFNVHKRDSGTFSLKINHEETRLIPVKTAEARQMGLSGQDSLPQNTAMFFIFDEPDKYGIWMRDMKFSIDIIWLDENNKITHLENNISPDTYPTTFFPPEKSLYIIEANSDFIEQNNLLVGNVLDISGE